jgi:hypothetical protein
VIAGVKRANHRGKILAALEVGPATKAELAASTGASYKHTQHILAELLSLGAITRDLSGKSSGSRGLRNVFRYRVKA